jgi:short-subunit dehydrogenase
MRWTARDAVAIVTGASSGIGRSLCRQLTAEGATVVAVARRQERLDALAAEAADQPGQLIPLAGDITSGALREQVVTRAVSIRDGAVDLLVNNAGVGAIGPFTEASEARLRHIMEVNFFAPVELIRRCIPALAAGRAPVICNIGSVLGHRAVPGKSEYCASKFALHGFSDAMRTELKPQGIQVTLVSPSTTRSEFFDSLVETDATARSKSLGSWPPDRVAKVTLKAIKRRRSEVILSLGGKTLVYADRVAPALLDTVLSGRPSRSADGGSP